MDGRTEREEFAQLTTSLTSMLTNLCRVVLESGSPRLRRPALRGRILTPPPERRIYPAAPVPLARLPDESGVPTGVATRLGGGAEMRPPSATARGPHRSLPVVPLIPDKRYYGEAPGGLRRGCRPASEKAEATPVGM